MLWIWHEIDFIVLAFVILSSRGLAKCRNVFAFIVAQSSHSRCEFGEPSNAAGWSQSPTRTTAEPLRPIHVNINNVCLAVDLVDMFVRHWYKPLRTAEPQNLAMAVSQAVIFGAQW